jgi:hypothetical protein
VAVQLNNRPKCTICDRVKQENNHWWLLVIGCLGDEIHIVAWSEALASVADGCACGEACAHKALSRWFESKTLDAPSVRSEAATATQGEN